jgi:predicted kinase
MMEADMADVINLKRFKKRNEREQAAKQADANRARFGRSKAERTVDQRARDRAADVLDQHRLNGGDAS